MMEKEICEGCEVFLGNATLEDRLRELEARIEALELFVESLKDLLLEKVGCLNETQILA